MPTDEALNFGAEEEAPEQKPKKKTKRLTLAKPLVIKAEVPTEETWEERQLKGAEHDALHDPRMPSELPGPGETAGRVAEFVGDYAVKPVLRTAIGLPVGLYEGVQSLFDHLVTSLAARGEMKEILGKLEDPNITYKQREALEDKAAALEGVYIDTVPFYAAYKNVDKETEERFAKDDWYINAMSDFREVTTAFPTLMQTFIDAAWGADPEAMRNLGFMISGGGIASTISILNPRKMGKNFAVRPVSVFMGLTPVARIIAKSPKALQALRGKAGKQADVLLRAIDTVDTNLRRGYGAVAKSELPGTVLSGVGSGAAAVAGLLPGLPGTASVQAGLRGLGKTGKRVVDVGAAARGRDAPVRLTSLAPGQQKMTLGDLGRAFVTGARHGMLPGNPVGTGAVYTALRALYPNTKWTRGKAAAVQQFLRHTSAQADAGSELAVRGIMMATARQRGEMRRIVEKIQKVFEEDGALTRKADDALEELGAGRRQQVAWDFGEGEFARIPSGDARAFLDKLTEGLDDPNLSRTARAKLNRVIKDERAKLKALEAAEEGGTVFATQRLSEVLTEFDTLMDSLGVSDSVKTWLRGRLANVGERNAILLQHGDLAERVVQSIYLGKNRAIPKERIRELVAKVAEEPYLGAKRLSTRLNFDDGTFIDLDKHTKKAFASLPVKKQREIQGAVASHSALRYQGLVSENATNAALKAEALKLGMGKNLDQIPFGQITPQAYAVELAKILGGKDVTPGSVSIPKAIPFSAGTTELAQQLRRLAKQDDALAAILAKRFGDGRAPNPTEISNFKKVLNSAADEIRDYVPQSADSLTNNLRRSILDDPNAPADLKGLAKSQTTNDFNIAPGLKSTLKWHSVGSGNEAGILHALNQMFKTNVTVRNLPGHLHNSAGNMGKIMVELGDDPVTFIRGMTTDGATYLNHKSGKLGKWQDNTAPGTAERFTNRGMSIVDKAGIANNDFVAAELLRGSRAGLMGGAESNAVKRFVQGLHDIPVFGWTIKKLDDLASTAYAKEDNLPKIRLGAQKARTILSDLHHLRPGVEYRFRTSPVSVTTLFKKQDGQLYRGKVDGPSTLVTPDKLDEMIAGHVRRHVDDFIVSYDELSGLNRLVVNSKFAGFVPFFTFFSKAMGIGGKQGFVEQALFSPEHVASMSPRVMLRQLKENAALMSRRAMLVNSFHQLATRERNMLAQALAYDEAMPNNVIFDVLTDIDAIQYRDLSGMSSFAPGEVKYRTLAWLLGRAAQLAGADKSPELSIDNVERLERQLKGKHLSPTRRAALEETLRKINQKRSFYHRLDRGEVAHMGTLGSVFGFGRGPSLSIAEILLNDGKDKYGNKMDLGEVMFDEIAPVLLPAQLAVAAKELLSQADTDMDIYTSRQVVTGDAPLNESRKKFYLRRMLYQGGRKKRFSGSTQSLLAQKKKLIKKNAGLIVKQLKRRQNILEGEELELRARLKQAKKAAAQGMVFGDTPEALTKSGMDAVKAELTEKSAAINATIDNLTTAEDRLETVIHEELNRLDEAYEIVRKAGSIRDRIRRKVPKSRRRRMPTTREVETFIDTTRGVQPNE